MVISMVKVDRGDTFHFDVYYVKEHYLKEAVGKDGIVNKIPVVKGRFLINPSNSYLNKENVEIVSHRVIKVQIMEVNSVGGKVVEQRYLIGMRFIDGNKTTPVFHIMVKNDKELKEKIAKEVEYYLKTSCLIKL